VNCGDDTVFEKFRKDFQKAGHTMPRVVFWNLAGARGGKQATSRQKNVVMVSGFAPASMANTLNSALLTPAQVMESVIAKYETMVTVPVTMTAKAPKARKSQSRYSLNS